MRRFTKFELYTFPTPNILGRTVQMKEPYNIIIDRGDGPLINEIIELREHFFFASDDRLGIKLLNDDIEDLQSDIVRVVLENYKRYRMDKKENREIEPHKSLYFYYERMFD